PPPSPEPTPEELEEIERALGADAAARAREQAPEAATEQPPAPAPSAGFSLQSLNPDISFIADVAGAWFTAEQPLQSGGHDPTENGFTLQQLELAVSSTVDPYFKFNANLVFGLFGVEIEEVYATTLGLPYRLQLRAGQFLTRFGRFNPTHLHAWQFVDQPFAIGRVFGGEGNRGLGAELSWLAPLPWYVEVTGSVTEARGEATARSFLGATTEPIRSPFDLQYTGAVKQFFPLSDDLSLNWGLSAATGPSALGNQNRTDVFGTDLYLKYRPISDPGNPTVVSLHAEILYRRRQAPEDLLQDVNAWAELFWRFAQRWSVAARYELGTPAYGLGGEIVPDPLDPEWAQSRQRASANLTFWPTEFSRVRLQGAADLVGWREAPSYSVMLALEFAVGAHGAHAF
ncbi:MAG: zinc-regulated TonB-dependent outer membrane receptor, partial [Myxococcaceae bacterium]